MQEKRGILGGEKNNMVKSQPKKEVNIINITIKHNINETWSMPYTYIVGTKSSFEKFNIALQKLIQKFSK